MNAWDRYSAVVTGRRSWIVLAAVVVVAAALMGLIGGNDDSGRAPESLPDTAESARVRDALQEFPGGDRAPVIVVVTRSDDAKLDAADMAAATDAVNRIVRTAPDAAPAGKPGLIPAPDGAAAIGRLDVPADLNGSALTEYIDGLRETARAQTPPGLVLQITGGPAFGADIADSFAGADVTLLAVTALVVAVLLIATYRSPVLWLVPLLIIGFADRTATTVGTALARVTGLTFDGSTAGITSVLVFGAGTNYALLLVSRYRDELHRHRDHRAALRVAVRRAGPAILASNITVVLALLVLLWATLPNTRSLGLLAAAGLLVAVAFVLLALPPALALCGRKVFWPFIPSVDERDVAVRGAWHTIANRVVAHPVSVAVAALVLLALCAGSLFGVRVGLSQTERFRVDAESVTGFDALAAHFPSGSADPTTVLAAERAAPQVQQALDALPEVTRASIAGPPHEGVNRWTVTLDAAPASGSAFAAIEHIRTTLADIPGAEAMVGGSDAQALDTRDASRRDLVVVIPLILAVVFAVLLVLLRAVPAAVLLIGVTVLSALAALGVGSWVGEHLFGFPALDTSVPLFAFLFLVALGVDYTIFLVARAKEETPEHGTTAGIVRAVSATGAVITSAGIVLAAVFCVLGVLPLITLTQLGIIVGIGIVLDTFLVRTVVIPALFELVGPVIWWPSRLTAER
ncbi:MMPL family transporter [Nocardia paucivorans]|uniref:MMPL family transporter n=1 Tax=Nocardia paucivorans TaxID=114259 RepID=UPI00030CF0FC|nr:MMPL family transporter [Nocardia paucivorans]